MSLTWLLALSTALTLGSSNSADGPNVPERIEPKPFDISQRELLLHQGILWHQIAASSSPEDEVQCVFVVYPLKDIGKEPIFQFILRKQSQTSPDGVATLMTSPVFNQDGLNAFTSLSLQIRRPDGRLINSTRKVFTKRLSLRGELHPRRFPQYGAGHTFLSVEVWDSPQSKAPIEAVGVFCADGKTATQLVSTLPRLWVPVAPKKSTKSESK